MTKLHIFDMDGTLLRGAASVEISRFVGQFDAAHAVEEAWLRGEIGDVRFWELVLPMWRGISEAGIDAAFEASPWIEGIKDVFADITQRGEHSIVISQSPQFFVSRLTRWGAGATYGAAVEPDGPVGRELLMTAEDKVTISTERMQHFGLIEADCVAYGDSTSDVALFTRLPHTVAVNANPVIRQLAVAEYVGSDLREAYALGRALLSGGGSAAPVEDIDEARSSRTGPA